MNLNPKLITVIVPCYNSENYISECLSSVLKQEYTNWECIVINDGSTDNSHNIIKQFTDKDSRFKCISQVNKGLSATRNIGIDLSTGEYIFFLDSDDILPEDSLNVLIKHTNSSNDIVTGVTMTIEGTATNQISELQHPSERNIVFENSNLGVLLRAVHKGLSPIAANKLYKKAFLLKNQLHFQERMLHEDELWFFETMLNAKHVKYIDAITYLYRVDNSSSITKNIGDKNIQSQIEILQTLFSYYKNENNAYRKAVMKRYIRYFKKIIIDFYLRESNKNISVDIKYKFLENLKNTITDKDNEKILTAVDERYYLALDKLSGFPMDKIKSNFFKNPVNSIRKQYKLLKIEWFLK